VPRHDLFDFDLGEPTGGDPLEPVPTQPLGKLETPAPPRPQIQELPPSGPLDSLEAIPTQAASAVRSEPRAPAVYLFDDDSASTTAGGKEPISAPPEEPEEDLIGVVLSGYRIVERIGHGSFAEVYRAKHVSLPRYAAIKVLRTTYAASEHMRRRMAREAAALARLDHPNIVRVIDFGDTPSGRAYLCAELLEGKTLRDRMLEGEIETDDLLRWTQEIARGLKALHAVGVVHRDLKPANVMLVPSETGERAKILDLGLARWIEPNELTQLTRADQLLGTPRYMAPEQIADPTDVDAAADLYALGAMLYEVMTGRPPYDGGRNTVVEKKRIHAPPPPIKQHGQLAVLVGELLARDVERRIATADQLIEELDQMVAEPTKVPLPPPKAAQTLERKALERARRSWMLPAIAVMLAFALGALWGAVLLAPDDPVAPIEEQRIATPAPTARRPALEEEEPPAPVEAAPAHAEAPAEVEEPARVRRAPREEPRPARADLTRIRARLGRALENSGFGPEDLALIADAPSAFAWNQAMKQGDPRAAEEALFTLERRIEQTPLDAAYVTRKVRRAQLELKALVGKHSAAELAPLEDRCFALLRALREGGADVRQLNRQAGQLLAEVRSAPAR
jgi:tRNA A-37 threonylcarbamoyl transferase component Bud32